jgi:hypothetical protein
MRNATDAALLVSPAWQAEAAHALASGITAFLQTAIRTTPTTADPQKTAAATTTSVRR